ncbi:tetratricopeptide repeat protein [Paraburkholderia sp.]|uniref:tetratricopeptide repeat protein n=1 Tax=Paraburkholderia sp. TaxID=1926495 RepID=UPI00239E4A60|nr:tetratricopeptide repeat protein [Paraburkholderia sp.]MDE1181275.1 tetratricopeptide repeat protein [Paraburkholderia sp.]
MSSIPEQDTPVELTAEQQFEQDIATVLQTALEQHHAGEFDDAEALYRAILEAKANHGDVNYNLGVLLVQTHRHADAIPLFENALGVNPNNGQFWLAYVDALGWTGQTEAAWLALEMGQQRGLKGPAVNGMIERLSDPKGYASAVAAATLHALKAKQRQDEITSAMQPDTAAAGPKAATSGSAKAPTPQEINQFAGLFNKGRIADAIRFAETLTTRYPAHGMSWRTLGVALYRNGQLTEAFEPLKKATSMLPDDTEARTLLINVLNVMGQHAEAETVCSRLLELKPSNAEAHRLLGTTLTSMNRLSDAIEAGRRAVELAPAVATMHSTLGVALLIDGQVAHAESSFRSALDLNALDDISHSNLLFCLTHRADVKPAQLFAEHREFATRHEAPVKANWPQHTNSRDLHRTLRVGLISGDLFRHAVSTFLEPVLKHLADDSSLSLHVYYNFVREDDATQRLRGYAAKWHGVTGMPDAALADTIRADAIDILIDLSGHTGRNRLLTFARKPAPVQASWIGYPNTTGLTAMDYYITNRAQAGNGFESQFTEKLAYLPAAAPFLPDDASPPVNALPASHKGYVTFGSFNRLTKLRRDVITLWAELLRAVPNSRMLIGAMPENGDFGDLLTWFDEEGISRDRLDLRKRSGISIYLQQHHQVDICLDTFPYAGGTTTLHALWMGIPTLTLRGDTMPGRAGETILTQVGLQDYIAADHADFVKKGVAFATDIAALTQLRNGMRARCENSARFQPEVIADSLSRALRTMWHRYCDGQPAASFDVTPDSVTVL